MRKRIRYSQNFLRNNQLVKNLLDKSSIYSNDIVYEIGAGDGIITKELLKKAKRVVAFELDRNLYDKLTQRFQGKKSLELRLENFLTYKLPNYSYKVFSNIPFNITSAIIKKLTLENNSPEDTYLIVQNEAAKKFAGKPIDNKNSQIAVILNPWFEYHIIHKFKASDFFPRPNIEIVLLEIRKRKKALIDTKNKQKYEDLITYAFNQFKPNIAEGLSNVLRKQDIIRLTKEFNFSPNSKPTELDFNDWRSLFNLFYNAPKNKQKLVLGSFTKQLRQQEKIEKIHRTRTDKNWKKGGGINV